MKNSVTIEDIPSHLEALYFSNLVMSTQIITTRLYYENFTFITIIILFIKIFLTHPNISF